MRDDQECAILCHNTPRCLAFETKPMANSNYSSCSLKDNQELVYITDTTCPDWKVETHAYYILDLTQKQARFLNDEHLKETKEPTNDTIDDGGPPVKPTPFDGRIQMFYNEQLFNFKNIRLFKEVPSAGNTIKTNENNPWVGWPLQGVLCPWRWDNEDMDKPRPVVVSTPSHTLCEIRKDSLGIYYEKYECIDFDKLERKLYTDEYCTEERDGQFPVVWCYETNTFTLVMP